MNRTFPLLIILVAVVIAGCGTSSGSGVTKADYERQVAAAGRTMAKTLTGMASSVANASSPQNAATHLDRAGDELDGLAKTFADIEPPSDVADAHRELADGVRGLASAIHDASGVAKSGNAAALAKIGSTLQESKAMKQIANAGRTIEANGYELGG